MTWRWFPRSDPDVIRRCSAFLEIDGRGSRFALRIHDGYAVWTNERGRVLLVMHLWS